MTREINYDHLFESQKQYRLLLDCMAKPGVIANLDADISVPGTINKSSALVGFVLLNSDVRFFNNFENSDELNEYFSINTSSSSSDAVEADFIFINGNAENAFSIENSKCGLPEYPEQGAFIIIDADQISDSSFANAKNITLQGPGVKDKADIFVSGISDEVIDAILEKNSEYPLGVDTIITDKNGKVFCIPRSNKLTYKTI